MANKYPPYVNAYGNISKLFDGIKSASVPPKFTVDFMSTLLGLKSSSYRAMIPLLKRLGFIDQGTIPTQTYKDYRDDSQSKAVMASRVKDAYSDLFAANEYAYKLSKQDISSKLITITGASSSDPNIPAVVGTFQELLKLSDFNQEVINSSGSPEIIETQELNQQNGIKIQNQEVSKQQRNFGISYTINLNLPATTEIEVFNAIFKSLKEHILNE